MRPSAQAFAADSCSDLLVFLLDMNNAPFVIDSVFISLSLIKGAYHFAGEPTQSIGKSFLKSYASVCLEGAVIVLACVIFSAFASSPPVVDAGVATATMVWSYIGELIFNMLILVGSVKMADRVVREMMGL